MPLVIGLSPNGNIHALHQTLAQAGLPTEPLRAIDPSDAPSTSRLASSGSGLLEPDGGTRVPGMNNSLQSAFSDDASPLDDLDLPESAVANFAEALERGHSVISYSANAADVERVETIFAGAGISNVRRF